MHALCLRISAYYCIVFPFELCFTLLYVNIYVYILLQIIFVHETVYF